MNRRQFLTALVLSAVTVLVAVKSMSITLKKIILSEKDWRIKLSKEQYNVLRDEGTEGSWSSDLNHESRDGTYVCTGCDLPLFMSEMKFDSGTGWPSFTTHIKDAIETKLDFKILYPRTEYHCARCGGHQGHVFNDGPKPTGKRWCNNGVALKFIPKKNEEISSYE